MGDLWKEVHQKDSRSCCGAPSLSEGFACLRTLQSVNMCHMLMATPQSVHVLMCTLALCQEEISKTNKTTKEGEYYYWRPLKRILGAKEALKRKRMGQLMIRMDEEGTPTYRLTKMKESETVKPNPWIPPIVGLGSTMGSRALTISLPTLV